MMTSVLWAAYQVYRDYRDQQSEWNREQMLRMFRRMRAADINAVIEFFNNKCKANNCDDSKCGNQSVAGFTHCYKHLTRVEAETWVDRSEKPQPTIVEDRPVYQVVECAELPEQDTMLIEQVQERRAASLIGWHYNTIGRRSSRRYEGFSGGSLGRRP